MGQVALLGKPPRETRVIVIGLSSAENEYCAVSMGSNTGLALQSTVA